MDSHGAGDGAARSDSRERRSESQHPKGKSRKDSRQKSSSASRGSSNWQRHENNPRPNFASYSDTSRPDVRLKIPSLKCEGLPPNTKRQNRSIKAECFVNLVYEDDRSARRERPVKTSYRKAGSNHRTVYTTENYMQANCQFVVDSNCSALAAKLREDPDFAPPWDTICEVRLVASTEPNCPICMNKPVARRITTCGHLFCLPCLIHYFTIKAEKMVPCPICFTKIDICCIKPVSIIHCVEYSIGDTISFALSRCCKGTTLVELVDADFGKTLLSNVVFASKVDMVSRLEADKEQLTKLLPLGSSASDSQEEVTFVNEALKLLESEILQVEASEVEAQNNSFELLGVSPPKPNNIVFYVDALHDHKSDSAQGDNSLTEPVLPIEKTQQESPPSVKSAAVGSGKPAEIDNSYYYFYQSMDGQRIYLNSFNVRCLQKQFGHLSQCPNVLEGKIVGIDYVSVTAEVRSQFRYLSHLPLYSHFQSAEIELDSVLSEEVIQQFASEMERRKSERTLRQTKEEAYSRRAETLMERITEKASGVAPLALDEPLVYDHAAFLADSPSLFSTDSNAGSEAAPPNSSNNNLDSPNNNGIGTTWPATSSFARILTEGRPLSDDFPTLGSPPSIPPSPAAIMVSAANSRSSSRVMHQNRVNNASPSPFAKVKYAKSSSSSATSAAVVESKPSAAAEDDEELAYAVPEAPRTLADCLSSLNLATSLQPDSPSSGGGWKKSKKKSEVRLLFSSGRGHALLN